MCGHKKVGHQLQSLFKLSKFYEGTWFFSLPDQNGNVHSLADYAGSWLVVYFTRRMTRQGTQEACDFRDAYSILLEKGKNSGNF